MTIKGLVMQITDQHLLDAGYKKYQDKLNSKQADTFYQKCVRDGHGKKYFIDVYGYNFSKYPQWTPDEWNTTGWSYMFIASYDSCGDHGFSFQPNHPSIDEESVEYYETLFETVWNTLKPDYYERYDE